MDVLRWCDPFRVLVNVDERVEGDVPFQQLGILVERDKGVEVDAFEGFFVLADGDGHGRNRAVR